LKEDGVFCLKPHIVALRPIEKHPCEGKHRIGEMTGLDLCEDILEDSRVGYKSDFDGRHGGWRRLLALGFGWTARRHPAIALAFARVTVTLPGARRPRAPLVPVAARPITVAAIALRRGNGLFAGKLSIALLVRLFLDPGGQKPQIEKIRRRVLLGHRSLYAKADGCKIKPLFATLQRRAGAAK
jgi:hypothetical protein